MRIERMLVDLTRLEALQVLPERRSKAGKHGFPPSDYLRIELTDSANFLPTALANDLSVFGWIIGNSELVGGPTVRALKMNFADGDVCHSKVSD
jgi:hypothetical protein